MVQELATLRGGNAFLHLVEKPLLVVHKALDRLLHKGARVGTSSGRKLAKPGLQMGTEIHFHAPKVSGNGGPCQLGDNAAS